MRPEIRKDKFAMAMYVMLHHEITQYLLSNLNKRANGALKAEKHESLTKHYIAVFKGIDPDDSIMYYETVYQEVHDATAEELTDHLNQEIGFDPNGYVDNDLVEKFFARFHIIAVRILSKKGP